MNWKSLIRISENWGLLIVNSRNKTFLKYFLKEFFLKTVFFKQKFVEQKTFKQLFWPEMSSGQKKESSLCPSWLLPPQRILVSGMFILAKWWIPIP